MLKYLAVEFFFTRPWWGLNPGLWIRSLMGYPFIYDNENIFGKKTSTQNSQTKNCVKFLYRNIFFWIVLYISDGDRFVHFFVLRLFYHSNLDSYNEELMIVHSVLFMGDASIQYSLLITKSLLHPGIEPWSTDRKSSALPT